MEIVREGPKPVPEGATEMSVRMRDGIQLATDVYLPSEQQDVPGPTILVRMPYDKTNGIGSPMGEYAQYMTDRGYRVVLQDVRGKFRSEGDPLLFIHEANDGYDTIDWVVNQPWSDGIVGMAGNSYYGYTRSEERRGGKGGRERR